MKSLTCGIALAFAGGLALAGSASAQTLSNPPGANPPPAARAPDAPTPPPQNADTACMPATAAPSANAALRVEVHDPEGLSSGASTVTVTDMQGKPVVTISCAGPWANFRLAPGHYQVSARIGDRTTQSVALDVPRTGARAVVTFAPEPWRDDEVL